MPGSFARSVRNGNAESWLLRLTSILRTSYLEDEEVSPSDWAFSWFQFMLSKELPFDCLLRLWDTYFSCPGGFKLHFFVSLAILSYFKEELLELEQSELKGFLQHLPAVDMDQVGDFVSVND